MAAFLILTAVTFSLFGFIIGVWADSFEQLQIVPLMVLTPLTFLGGAFYSITMLPPLWQKITLFNPVVYLISGFRWSFFGVSDVNVLASARRDLRLSGGVRSRRELDIQDRLQAQELNCGRPWIGVDLARERPWHWRSGIRTHFPKPRWQLL
jgi:hypothetical protein